MQDFIRMHTFIYFIYIFEFLQLKKLILQEKFKLLTKFYLLVKYHPSLIIVTFTNKFNSYLITN